MIMAWGLTTACAEDSVVQPTGAKVSVCHRQGAAAAITAVFISELAAHKSHGDYVTSLEVSKLNAGADSIHFRRITDALAVARAGRLARNELETAACRITIAVAAGTLDASGAQSSDPTVERLPLMIDVPDITLTGALKMQVDAGGRATGASSTGEVTTIRPNPALATIGVGVVTQRYGESIIFVNGHPVGSKGHGVEIEGFVLQSGQQPTDTVPSGQGITSLRVNRLVVRGVKLEGGFQSAISLQASNALVERNHFSGLGGCDLCLAGPGDFIVRDNRLMGPGGLPGIFLSPVIVLPRPPEIEEYTLPATALVTAVITNNEVRGHLRSNSSVGIRIGAIGPGAPNVISSSKAVITSNTLIGNVFGMFFEAAFPVVGSALRGDIEVTTSGNTFSGSCQNDVAVSFTRHASGLGLPSQFPSYLRNSTYDFSFGSDIAWDKAWFSHPAGFGNTLVVNGQTMPNGTRHAYDASRSCT